MKTVAQVFDIGRLTDGDVGIEIEVEGRGLPGAPKEWHAERDGSLQGESCEYVLAKPSTLNEAQAALRSLEKTWKENGTKIDKAVRAGVHVHVNCQHLNMIELVNFITIFLLLENVLTKWCGPTREGNLFCLRSKDADYLLEQIRKAIKTKIFRKTFGVDDLRYAAMNVKALVNYGSLEFRAMRSDGDLGKVGLWANTLVGLRGAARGFQSPNEIIEQWSLQGPTDFAQNLLGKFYEEVWVSYRTEKEFVNDLFDGMRNAQYVAYAIPDWNKWYPKTRKVGQLDFPLDQNPDEPNEDF